VEESRRADDMAATAQLRRRVEKDSRSSSNNEVKQ